MVLHQQSEGLEARPGVGVVVVVLHHVTDADTLVIGEKVLNHIERVLITGQLDELGSVEAGDTGAVGRFVITVLVVCRCRTRT